jgi:hypothetical protein
MPRVKVTTNRDQPRWGANKKTGKKMQRERDLLNRIHELQQELQTEQGLRTALNVKLSKIEAHHAAMAPREKLELSALQGVCRIPYYDAARLGIAHYLLALMLWADRIEKARP